MMETRFVTKIFDDEESIDDWLDGLAVQVENVEIVGYTAVLGRICITVEVEYDDEKLD